MVWLLGVHQEREYAAEAGRVVEREERRRELMHEG